MLKHNATPMVVWDLFGAGGECNRVGNSVNNGTEFKAHVSSAEQISCYVVCKTTSCATIGHVLLG
jgi:hypothetical protein